MGWRVMRSNWSVCPALHRCHSMGGGELSNVMLWLGPFACACFFLWMIFVIDSTHFLMALPVHRWEEAELTWDLSQHWVLTCQRPHHNHSTYFNISVSLLSPAHSEISLAQHSMWTEKLWELHMNYGQNILNSFIFHQIPCFRFKIFLYSVLIES